MLPVTDERHRVSGAHPQSALASAPVSAQGAVGFECCGNCQGSAHRNVFPASVSGRVSLSPAHRPPRHAPLYAAVPPHTTSQPLRTKSEITRVSARQCLYI